jgi:foldase protein PrsA
MTSRNLRKLSVFGAGLAAAGTLAACGGVPGNAVVTVDGQTIKKSTFDHWTQIIANSQRAQTGQKGKAMVPDAPEFKRCIADKQKNAPKPAKGQPEQTPAQHKQACEQEYDTIKNQALQLLIRSTWLDQEAERQEVSVSDKDVEKRVEEQRKQSFPNEKDWNEFLDQLGATKSDIAFDARQGLLEQKITEKITKDSEKVSKQEIENYYNKNKKQFADPERRDLRIVLTKEKSRAEQAKKALDGGASWKATASRFSIDEATKSQGGVLVGVVSGQQEKALDEAIFKAERGELSGPVKTQFGWYVFQVTKVTEAKQRPLKEVEAQIKQIVQSEKRNKAINDFSKEYRERWKEATECRDGYVTPDCKNGPSDEEAEKEQQQQQQPPGGAPPQGAPQGPPPGGEPGGPPGEQPEIEVEPEPEQ